MIPSYLVSGAIYLSFCYPSSLTTFSGFSFSNQQSLLFWNLMSFFISFFQSCFRFQFYTEKELMKPYILKLDLSFICHHGLFRLRCPFQLCHLPRNVLPSSTFTRRYFFGWLNFDSIGCTVFGSNSKFWKQRRDLEAAW